VGHQTCRTIVALVAAALAGTALGAAPATADVSLTPTQAVRGGAVKLTFRVPEDRAPAYTTRVEVWLPEATPVAETYPMSVPDWAPRTTVRTLARPVGGLPGGTEVVAGITWVRADGAPRTGAPAELSLSLGPLPDTDRLVFTVRQTYSDGVVTSWDEAAPPDGASTPTRPAPVLTLLPAAADPAVGVDPAAGVPEPRARAGTGTGGPGSPAVGAVAGLVAVATVGVWLLLRRRRDGRAGRAWRLRQ